MPTPMHILLVEDSADDAELLEIELIRGGLKPSIHRVETLGELTQALESDTWDVVLSDFHLPGFDAERALQAVQRSGFDIPFIIVSGAIQAEDAVTLLKQGAHDFLNKDSLARLVPAIERERREANERAERRQAEERVRVLSLAIEQSPVSVVISDCRGLIEYVNPTFEAITGYTLAEAQGRPLEFTRYDQSASNRFQPQPGAGSASSVYQAEFCNIRKNGQLFWEHATVSPLRDGEGGVSHYVAVKEDITARRSFEERLLKQANYDELTGLPNRVLMLDRLVQSIAKAKRSGTRTALLFIDLDRFKNVNDILGHRAGDSLIQEAAVRFGHCVREGDTLARMGGDEFIIILPEIEDSSLARRVAERVIETSAIPFTLQGQDLFVTASIGVTLFPDDGTDAQTLLRNADLAMYKAKELGRNGFHFFTQEINQRMQERLAIEGRLRGALDRHEFLLHYQPIVDLRNSHVVAMEALLRWREPDNNLRMPDQFISLAEETGAIRQIGAWVITSACAQARKLRVNGNAFQRIAVNVSPKQLQVAGFAQFVSAQLGQLELEPDALELEITESVLLDDSPETAVNLRMLCDGGIRLSIDDFGTGYSALGYLQRYPFHTLKIDRSFVSHATANAKAARLIETIVTMGHRLGMEIVAEGVETSQQLDFLREQECDFAQGYLFGRPAAL
ncbi:EAL domain-containing protein [Telmatospirillum sp.]|uniref:EAL domain-containing response regulator n=1 Tax=Telmatospirillum sp. TaxID=2079197 RepID=UPI0028434E18|nr:EAL domain-containing protein [Telmatospirillum sp.]MDR3437459.1 EAL domain-containing protein [Telmatospirillum sp.]